MALLRLPCCSLNSRGFAWIRGQKGFSEILPGSIRGIREDSWGDFPLRSNLIAALRPPPSAICHLSAGVRRPTHAVHHLPSASLGQRPLMGDPFSTLHASYQRLYLSVSLCLRASVVKIGNVIKSGTDPNGFS